MFCASSRSVKTLFKISRLFFGSVAKPVPTMAEPGESLSPNSMTSVLKLKTRYNGRIKKRKWEERGEGESSESHSKRNSSEPYERIKRKNVAMLLSYSGSNYHGMQRNPDMNTIEEELFKALLASKYITEEAFDQIQLINFQRAARTDRGVSAVRQIVSLKMPNEVNIPDINQHLPPEIRVFSIKRVTKGFNSKSNCDARTYIYTMPTYAFEDDNKVIEDYKSFRISTDIKLKVDELLKQFLGTKNFHNFTSKKDFVDPSCNRYIIKFECGEPFVRNDFEFVTIKIKGQSFILHQIRKMVGSIIAIIRGLASNDLIKRALTSDQIDIPTAPGLGLVLDQVHYESYNQRYGADGIHESLQWDEVEKEINAFKEKHIISTIVDSEIKEMQMADWLPTLHKYTYEKREIERKHTAVIEEVGLKDAIECEQDDENNDETSQNIEEKIKTQENN